MSFVPVVFRHGGIQFYFYSNEGNPREPPHVDPMLTPSFG